MHIIFLGKADVHDVEITQEVVEAHPERGAESIALLVIVVLLLLDRCACATVSDIIVLSFLSVGGA